MRVLLTGGKGLTQSLWILWRGFERAGHDPVYVRADNNQRPKGPRSALYTELRRELSNGAELVVWWQPRHSARAGEIAQLRNAFPGVPWVMQSLDDPFILENRPGVRVFQSFDMAVTCCEGAVPWYERRGVAAIVGYPPVDRDLHGQAISCSKDRAPIGFVAWNVYANPARYPDVLATRLDMAAVARKVARVRLYGGWGKKDGDWQHAPPAWRKDFHGYRAWNGPLQRAFNSSKINLNSHVRPSALRYLNDRATLCPASGGFMLCDKVNGIEELFKPNVEAVFWSSLEELRDKLHWWLAHEKQRKRVARAGRRRALAEFDNERLARRIVDASGLLR